MQDDDVTKKKGIYPYVLTHKEKHLNIRAFTQSQKRELYEQQDSFNTYDLGKYYVVLPTVSSFKIEDFKIAFNAKKVTQGFSYNSGDNTEWETVESLRELIKDHVDNSFEV